MYAFKKFLAGDVLVSKFYQCTMIRVYNQLQLTRSRVLRLRQLFLGFNKAGRESLVNGAVPGRIVIGASTMLYDVTMRFLIDTLW